MEENREFNSGEIIDEVTGEIKAEQDKPKHVENLRVAKVLFLGAQLIKNRKKEVIGINLSFVDAVETDNKTGQPVLRGFKPVITCYVKDPTPEVTALLNMKVFSTLFIRISGNDDFTQFHGVLSEKEIAMYRQLMGELLNR